MEEECEKEKKGEKEKKEDPPPPKEKKEDPPPPPLGPKSDCYEVSLSDSHSDYSCSASCGDYSYSSHVGDQKEEEKDQKEDQKQDQNEDQRQVQKEYQKHCLMSEFKSKIAVPFPSPIERLDYNAVIINGKELKMLVYRFRESAQKIPRFTKTYVKLREAFADFMDGFDQLQEHTDLAHKKDQLLPPEKPVKKLDTLTRLSDDRNWKGKKEKKAKKKKEDKTEEETIETQVRLRSRKRTNWLYEKDPVLRQQKFDEQMAQNEEDGWVLVKKGKSFDWVRKSEEKK